MMSDEIIEWNGKKWKVTKYKNTIIKYELICSLTNDAFGLKFYTSSKIVQDQYYVHVTPQVKIVDVVLAKEGVFPYPERNRREAKRAEELKEASKLVDTIPAFDRHPQQDERSPDIVLGMVRDIKFDDRTKALKGKLHLYRDRVKMYRSLNDAIDQKKPFPVSVGQYNQFGGSGVLNGERYDAEQINILLDHLAILTHGEEPRCELGVCGINVADSRSVSLNQFEKKALKRLF